MEVTCVNGERAQTAGTVDGQLRLGPPAPTKYVKVTVPGVALVRKVDVRAHRGHAELKAAIFGLIGEQLDLVVAFEDDAGNVKLAGDLQWDTFVDSCKKLVICKRGEV